jgi:D-alanyl-lipoteichoic acid acyltransferase DltB (MBOAT superfamily)
MTFENVCLDLMQTTDNMKRCVCNNYTFAGFWRSWHASLHVWILRYMYLPLGEFLLVLLALPSMSGFSDTWISKLVLFVSFFPFPGTHPSMSGFPDTSISR